MSTNFNKSLCYILHFTMNLCEGVVENIVQNKNVISLHFLIQSVLVLQFHICFFVTFHFSFFFYLSCRLCLLMEDYRSQYKLSFLKVPLVSFLTVEVHAFLSHLPIKCPPKDRRLLPSILMVLQYKDHWRKKLLPKWLQYEDKTWIILCLWKWSLKWFFSA